MVSNAAQGAKSSGIELSALGNNIKHPVRHVDSVFFEFGVVRRLLLPNPEAVKESTSALSFVMDQAH
jgi:hypothetical protein